MMLRAFGSTRMILLVGLGVALLAIPVMEGKPSKPVTAVCTFTGDIDSHGPVEVGAKTWTYALRDPVTGGMTPLWLLATLLRDWDTGEPYVSQQVQVDGKPVTLEAGDYFGQARILTERLDFEFGPLVDGQPCTSPVYEDVPPFGVPGTDNAHLCPFLLVIIDGVYDRTLDRVVWDPDSEVHLVDYSQGAPCDVDPTPPCIGPPDYFRVGSGPLGALVAQFHADDGGDTTEQCKDKQDNDGDGDIDCDDSDCTGTKWCS